MGSKVATLFKNSFLDGLQGKYVFHANMLLANDIKSSVEITTCAPDPILPTYETIME